MDQSSVTPMWVMVAGPYSSGGMDAAQRAANLRTLNEAAFALHRLGLVPITGFNMACPSSKQPVGHSMFRRLDEVPGAKGS